MHPGFPTHCRLDDFDNACSAYEKALVLGGHPGEPVFHLNYAITLHQHNDHETAKLHLQQFRELFEGQDEGVMNSDPDILEQSHVLGQLLSV